MMYTALLASSNIAYSLRCRVLIIKLRQPLLLLLL
jgi:hypothetical protein